MTASALDWCAAWEHRRKALSRTSVAGRLKQASVEEISAVGIGGNGWSCWGSAYRRFQRWACYRQ
jgi:hypothetical protein